MATEVIVHHLAQTKATINVASELGLAVQLRSCPGAAAYAGVGFLQALGDAVGQPIIIDCDDDAGLAMAALRSGSKHLLLSAPSDLLLRIKQMAASHGAEVHSPNKVSSHPIVLSPDDDAGDIRAMLIAPATL